MSKHSSILKQYPQYKMNIGIEVHVQLNTKSKIFCSCPNEVIKDPNINICNICTAHPGSLPVLNKKVVDYAILAGLATNSDIAKLSTFARKHYFYPDLPKNYQISQGEKPICQNGFIPIRLEDGSIKNIRLIRIHMEEDAGKNIHAPGSNESFVNLNRTGTPLLEIVSYPDIESTYEAKEYLKALHAMVKYLGICSGNMEEGAFRADTNISLRPKDREEWGTRSELKNINSFKYISDAIEYEIERQADLLDNGKKVTQETRGWDTTKKQSFSMRSKEEAADYRYFQDPDLPLIQVNEEWISRIKKQMPELPHQKFDRFVKDIGLSEYEAQILVEDKQLADYFEHTYNHAPSKQIVNWILRDVMGLLKEKKISIGQCLVSPKKLADIVNLVANGTINGPAAKEIFAIVAETGNDPAQIVKEKGLEQIGSAEELEAIVTEIIAANPENVVKYKSGKDKLFGFFVGQTMKKTQGKGNPKIIQKLLKKHLG